MKTQLRLQYLSRFLALGCVLLLTQPDVSDALSSLSTGRSSHCRSSLTPLSMAIALPRKGRFFSRRRQTDSVPYVSSRVAVAVPLAPSPVSSSTTTTTTTIAATATEQHISASLELPRRTTMGIDSLQDKVMSRMELVLGRLVMTAMLALMAGEVLTGLFVIN